MNKESIIDILKWDTGNWSIPLNYWEKIIGKFKPPLTCLELGANEGGISLWLALQGHTVICSDLENTELNAKPLHGKYQFTGKISYKNINALSIPYENHFDVVIFKSILGGIGRNNHPEVQQKVIDQIYKSLKPGGIFLFAENGKATMMHRYFRKTFTKWGSDWRYVSPNDMNKFLIAFTNAEIKTTGFAGVFGGNEKQKIFLSGVDKYFFNGVVPGKWKYIIYGSAIKKENS